MPSSDGHTDASSQEFAAARENFRPAVRAKARSRRAASTTPSAKRASRSGKSKATKMGAKPRKSAVKLRKYIRHRTETGSPVPEGAIDCNCGDERDLDEYTVECEGCKKWKHPVCMG